MTSFQKKSDEAYANQMKSVFNLLDDDKAKEEYSIKISKDLFGSNKNRKRPSPRNQDEEENQKSDDEDEDSKSKSLKLFIVRNNLEQVSHSDCLGSSL